MTKQTKTPIIEPIKNNFNNKIVRYWLVYLFGSILLSISIYFAASVKSTIGVVAFLIALTWWTIAHILTDGHQTPGNII